MFLLWSVVVASCIVAFAAWTTARRSARRLAQLSEMYWELRYQYGELRSRVQGMTGEAQGHTHPTESPVAASRDESFVPLSSLKR